jgi:hypothetical protein
MLLVSESFSLTLVVPRMSGERVTRIPLRRRIDALSYELL